MPSATVHRGPLCRHCRLPVHRTTEPELVGQWVHANDNVFCASDLLGMGLVAKFAEPG